MKNINYLHFTVLIVLLVTINACTFFDKKQKQDNSNEMPIADICLSMDSQEFPDVKDVNIETLIAKETEFHGMIGDDIQNMRIVFTSIHRINEREYEIIGKSKVRNNICDFKGFIEVIEIVETDFAGGDEAPNIVDGKIIGNYRFNEDKNQSGAGIFEGMFEIYWAHYEDSIGVADIWYTYSHYNILFDGTWESNHTGKTKKACWSDYKACFPEGFNVSDGPDLIPNEKYRSKGWDYMIDLFSQDEEKKEKAFAEYNRKWWK